jgi:hypothetical protein
MVSCQIVDPRAVQWPNPNRTTAGTLPPTRHSPADWNTADLRILR